MFLEKESSRHLLPSPSCHASGPPYQEIDDSSYTVDLDFLADILFSPLQILIAIDMAWHDALVFPHSVPYLEEHLAILFQS
jgi:hypothetical protein